MKNEYVVVLDASNGTCFIRHTKNIPNYGEEDAIEEYIENVLGVSLSDAQWQICLQVDSDFNA